MCSRSCSADHRLHDKTARVSENPIRSLGHNQPPATFSHRSTKHLPHQFSQDLPRKVAILVVKRSYQRPPSLCLLVFVGVGAEIVNKSQNP
jgi:hypothetical protein